MDQLKKYNKLWVHIVAMLAVIFGPEHLGLVEDTEQFTQLALAILSALGLFQIRNQTT